ncbi:hypothetical protein VKT23_020724 [Stygiomarasmius scandens]|uniref:Carboxylic ester hydrolase n=1 Tax=Marasmiellus scandens TaxID=2682957 RepID=A0ABR1IIG9_9AGAR
MPSFDSLASLPKNHPHIRLLTGKTPFFASTFDQRFSFSLYVPKGHSFSGPELPLLVIIHGTRRQTGKYADKLKQFCEDHNVVLMTPLFPAGIEDPEDLHNYKNIIYNNIRFDTLLLSMIDQASRVWRLQTDRFYLHGFSGGGQFAHRFLYLYPDRLAGVSIGAPGRITQPDTDHSWPAGLGGVEQVFGICGVPNHRAVAQVPIQLVVGEEDENTALLKLAKKKNQAESEAENRVERIQWLKAAWEKCGIQSELAVVPGVGHDGIKCLSPVEEWFVSLIKGQSTTGREGGKTEHRRR